MSNQIGQKYILLIKMGSSKSKEKQIRHEDQYFGYVEGFYNGNGYYGENSITAGGITIHI